MTSVRIILLTSAIVGISAPTATAQQMEKVRVATTFLGLWDTSQPTFCKDRGEFAKAGLDVEVASTRGGSENVQAVTAGGMDIGFSPGANAVFAAYRQGAKIKIVSAEFKGQNDTFFYVRSDSPLKSIGDMAGKAVSFPRPGGASEALLLGLKNERKLDFKMVATGGMDATFTMTMTKQVDVGYAVLPSVLDAVEKGQVRMLFSGENVESQKNLSNRVIIASSDFVRNRRPVAQKFLEVLDRCIDWSYANIAESSKMYAALNKIEPAIAAKALSFYKRDMLAFGPMVGMDELVKQSVENKFIDKPLTPDEIKDLVDILYSSKK
jgi:NitT/TauT family transport system substrate-binding protein